MSHQEKVGVVVCSRIIFKDRERHQGVFVSWKSMMSRCYRKANDNYQYYGGRGVIVCERWRTFLNFYEDLKEGWFQGATIDRFPICDGNYVPENVRWATIAQQNRNQTSTKLTEEDVIEIRKSTLSQAELAIKYNVQKNTINRVINRKRWADI